MPPRIDGLVRLELWHGEKFVGDNSYVGGKVEMFEDFDYSCSDYDYVVGAVRYLGYTEIFKCGFKEISEIESYVFFHDDSSYDDNICRCVDNENDVLRVYVDVGFLIPAANGVMRGENEDYQVDLDAFDDMIDVEFETNDVLGDSSGAEIELDDSDSSIATDASLYSDEDSEAIEKNKSTMIAYAKNCDHKTLKFEIGMRFKDYKECRDAVKLWAILNGYNIKWMKFGRHKLQARCEDNCSWRLYASTLTKEPTFMIKTYHEKHTCVRATRNIQANSQWVADMFMPKLKSNPNYRAIDIKNDCRLTYRITVTKSLCYRAKKTTEDQYRETYEEHYSKVRPYVADLMKMNKEGRFQLKTYLDNEDRPMFQRLYIGFSCLRKGFLVGCRRAIGFDACFLKTVLGGALLAAIAKDCNMKMYPIAWAVVEKETEETWSWFFEILFEDLNIGDGFGWTFMSDKQKGLISGIQKLAPNAEHRHCARHIYANWKKQFGGPKYKALFWDVVKSTSQTQYHYKLNQLKVESVAAYEDFCNRGPQTFCKSLISPFTKCDMIENNICESFNSYILKSRDKPLIEMLEDIMMSLMSRMWKIAKRLTACDDILCPNIRKKLDKLLNSARLCEMVLAIGEEFEVHYFDETYIVDLMKNECSCNAWALTGLPCCHAMACILDAREKLEKYIDDFFYKSTCVATYRHGLRPRHGPREWSSINEAHVLPPQYTKRPGRPKKNRKRDQHELPKHLSNKLPKTGIKITCSKCGQIGHNKRTCKQENPRVQEAVVDQLNLGRQSQHMSKNPSNSSSRTNEDQALLRRERRLTSQGCGVRFFPGSGNVWARTPGGNKVQFISGARAAAVATSNLGVRDHGRSQTTNQSTSTRFEARSSQNSKVIDSSTPNSNF